MKKQMPMKILLVEDNLHDIEITQRAFLKGSSEVDLTVIRHGQEVLDYLDHRGKFHPPEISPRPDLILLDLNLPKMSGLEVLKQIKEDINLKPIPVIILTGSQRKEDIVPSYALGANTYIQKPVKFSGFMRIVESIQEYWVGTATLPLPEV